MIKNTEANQHTSGTYLRPNEAAKYLRVSRRTLSNMMSAGKIPFSRMSERLLLIRRMDLDRAVDAFRVG